MDCIFCRIAKEDSRADIVFFDKDVIVFTDINPKAPVHLLVVPKEHIQSIAHLEASHADIVAKLIYTAKSVAEKMGLSGYQLVFNVGRDGGQVVDHLHLHLLGGWKESDD
ncbi:MAG: HIT domain-containing protein [Candidatus Sungbacteria bacterium]|nr:HIT domain-containing protein [Candidatus Sungbacteria bacterium]